MPETTSALPPQDSSADAGQRQANPVLIVKKKRGGWPFGKPQEGQNESDHGKSESRKAWTSKEELYLAGASERTQNREVQMRKEHQLSFSEVILERYKLKVKREANQQTIPQSQKLDDLADYCIKAIALSNGVDFGPDPASLSEEEMVAKIEENKASLFLENIGDPELRSMAFFVVYGSELELLEAGGLESELLTSQGPQKGLSRRLTEIVGRGVGGWVADSRLVTRLEEMSAGVIENDARGIKEQWMARRRQGRAIGLSDTADGSGRESGYAAGIRMYGENALRERAREVAFLREKYIQAATGVKGTHGVFFEEVTALTTGSDRLQEGSRFIKKAVYAEAMKQVLEGEYKVASLSDLSWEERMPAMLKAVERAIGIDARAHVSQILEVNTDESFTDDRIGKARDKIAGIKPDEVKSPNEEAAAQIRERRKVFAEQITIREQVLNARVNYDLINAKEEDQKIQSIRDNEAKLKKSKNDLETAKAGSPKDVPRLTKAIENAEADLKRQRAELQTLQNQRLAIEDALRETQWALDRVLTQVNPGDKDSDIAKLIRRIKRTNKYSPNDCRALLRILDTQTTVILGQVQADTETRRRQAQASKEAGVKTLEIIKSEARNEVLAGFIGTGPKRIDPDSISDPRRFIEAIGLGKDGAGSDQVLTPVRLARQLVMHFNIESVDPMDINDGNFSRYWPQIFAVFRDQTDGFARARAVMAIYDDRLNAIEKTGDCFADVMDYSRPKKERELRPSEGEESIESAWQRAYAQVPGRDVLLESAGDYVLVANKGKLTMYRRVKEGEGRMRFAEAKSLGIAKLGSGDIAVAVPGPESARKARGEILARLAAKQVKLEAGNNQAYKKDIKDNEGNIHHVSMSKNPDGSYSPVITGWTPKGGTAQPYTKTYTPQEYFSADKGNLAHFYLQEGGKYAMDVLEAESIKLETYNKLNMAEVANQGLQISIPQAGGKEVLIPASAIRFDPRKPPGSFVFRDAKMVDDERCYVILDQNTVMVGGFKMGADGKFVFDANIKLEDQEAVFTSAYSYLLSMNKEDRQNLGFSDVGVDFYVEGETNFSGRVTLSVDDEGELVIYGNDGQAKPLTELVNRAMIENPLPEKYSAVQRDTSGKVVHNRYLNLQIAAGMEFFESLRRNHLKKGI